jgi:hypothetical protein
VLQVNTPTAENSKKAAIEAAAAIPEVIISPTRCSPRFARSSDEHALSKAERRTAEKNLEHEGGISSTILVSSLNLNCAVDNILQLGVTLGSNMAEHTRTVHQLLEDFGSSSPLAHAERESGSESEEERVEDLEKLATNIYVVIY